MKSIVFKGCGTALATPFDENGVNFDVFGKMIENQIRNKVDALIVCGTTGESSTMSEAERKETIKYVVDKVNGRIPVIAGTGSNNTTQAINLTKYAEEVGCDACLVVTPYYNKTSQAGLISHFFALADATSLPIILYNVPSRTGVNIQPATYQKLCQHPNIVATKEASGDLSQIANIRYLCGDALDLYSGNDDQTVPILSLGGKGVISVLSNVAPRQAHDMCQLYFDGKVQESADLQIKLLPLINALFSDVNPIPVKEAMNLLGWKAGAPRLPLIPLDGARKEILKKALQDAGLL